ncbi:histone-arginine methyltransferase METTL23 isoform X2 [Cebidichthys violaceus]|uniref:histone-arginine methyltransferase METTL23 isoform X2 n=1 Tax=Cebidichthys violaceus TaxID=271503 RepID=UPI0035CB2DB2
MDHSGAEAPSIAYKVFTFKDKKTNTQDSLSVSIPEVLDPHYGMYVWPCAVVLAQYLWKHREELRDKTVLELGAGVSLPGVVASRCGAKVFLSDGAETPLCLENCRRSCEANGLREVAVSSLIWGEVSPELLLLPELDLVLGSDVFYEPQDFEDVLLTVAFLLRRNPRAQFWTTYQERRWGLKCVDVGLDSFDADEAELAGSTLPGNHSVVMMIITGRTADTSCET